MTDEEWEAIKPYAEAAERAAQDLKNWGYMNTPTETRARLENAVEYSRLVMVCEAKKKELSDKMRELEICLN